MAFMKKITYICRDFNEFISVVVRSFFDLLTFNSLNFFYSPVFITGILNFY